MIVITGATGNVGRTLVENLATAGEQVTAVSRRNLPVSTPDGVRHRQADLADPETLGAAFAGGHALFLLVAGAGAHLDAGAILGAAKTAGIERVVLLSSQAAGTRPNSVSHAPLRDLERAVQQSGMDWTVLRPGGFTSNTFAWAPSIQTRRSVAAPFGDVGLPLVDPADIAAVAAAALRERGHDGSTYELTGPALTTPRERARTIGEVLGEPILFEEQTVAEARAQMLQFMPPPVVEGTLDIVGTPTAGEQRISPDISRVLGREALPFADWVRRNIAAFR